MLQVKNIHFTLIIRTPNRLREFNFRKRNPALYDTDVSDDRGTRYFFKMVNENEKWMISGSGLPVWITDSSEIIDKSLAQQDALV